MASARSATPVAGQRTGRGPPGAGSLPQGGLRGCRAPRHRGLNLRLPLVPERSLRPRGWEGCRSQGAPGCSQPLGGPWTSPASLPEVPASQRAPPCFPEATALLRPPVRAWFYKAQRQGPRTETEPACRGLRLSRQATASPVPGPGAAVSPGTARSSCVGPWAPVLPGVAALGVRQQPPAPARCEGAYLERRPIFRCISCGLLDICLSTGVNTPVNGTQRGGARSHGRR